VCLLSPRLLSSPLSVFVDVDVEDASGGHDDERRPIYDAASMPASYIANYTFRGPTNTNTNF